MEWVPENGLPVARNQFSPSPSASIVDQQLIPSSKFSSHGKDVITQELGGLLPEEHGEVIVYVVKLGSEAVISVTPWLFVRVNEHSSS